MLQKQFEGEAENLIKECLENHEKIKAKTGGKVKPSKMFEYNKK